MNRREMLAGLFLISAAPVFSQWKPAMWDISDALSGQEFQEIVRFILDNGDRETYCRMYRNNPHYRLDNMVDIYLNPVSREINTSAENFSDAVSDYQVIHLRPIMTDLRLFDGKVYYDENTYGDRADPSAILKLEGKEGLFEYKIRRLFIPKLKALIGKEVFFVDTADWVDMSEVFGKEDIAALLEFVDKNGDRMPWSQRYTSIHYRFEKFDMFIDLLFLHLTMPANAPAHDQITIPYGGYMTMYIINGKLYAYRNAEKLVINEIIPEIKKALREAKR